MTTESSDSSAYLRSSSATTRRIPATVRVVAILWCVLGAIAIFRGVFVLHLATGPSLMRVYGYKGLLPVLLSGTGIAIGIAILSVLVGYALLKSKSKSRIWKVAVGISLLYIALGIGLIITTAQGWFTAVNSLIFSNVIAGPAYCVAGAVLLTLLIQKNVRSYLGVHYGSRRKMIISSSKIVAMVTVPTVLAFLAYGYTAGFFHSDATYAIDRISFKTYHLDSSIVANEWSAATDMPVAKDESMAAVIGSKIYLVGGHNATVDPIRNLHIYDTISKTWSEGKALPMALDHAGVASYHGKLYVVGGFAAGKGRPPSNALFILDPATNEWARGEDMPTARAAPTAQFINGILYAVGGWNKASLTANEAYDPVTNSWTSRAPMPTARDHLTSGVIDGKLYVIGGRQGNLLTNQNVNEEYDPERNEWTAKKPMPSYRSGLGAASLSDSIYVFGGENPVKAFDNNEQYVPSLDIWIVREKMPTARHGLAVAEVNGSIYVIGGSLYPGTYLTGKNEVFTPANWKTAIEDLNP